MLSNSNFAWDPFDCWSRYHEDVVGVRVRCEQAPSVSELCKHFIVVVTFRWLYAGSLGIAPSVLRMAQRHREISRHRPCVDSR